ncbi:nebulin-related-anchoring protein [Neosynchiropus ocellatus]
MQACARCGFIVYPAEKINCIDQNWHKACFHCDVCKMVLTANNFVSHNKRPYCSVHNPRNNMFTSVYETPVNINVKKKACIEVTYAKECEQLQGKGSFPAMITPGYSLAKKAQENASDVGYKKDLENTKSHSINFCETPQFQNVAKVAKFTSDNQYRAKYTSFMKGHYEDSGIDKKTLHAMKARTLASDISYKQSQEQDQEYNYQATLTPGYQSQKKLDPLKEKNYRQNINQIKHMPVTDTPEIILARKNAQLVSKFNYTADYENSKHQYTLSQDLPQFRKAKANTNLFSDIKYKEKWEKTKSKACDISVHDISVKAAKASRDLASDIKYKENYVKNKEKTTAMNVSDSKTLHSLQAAKICSNIEYKKDSKESQAHYSLPMDMIHLSHAKKAQALASDLAYRTKVHDYTIMPDDIKLQQAKKVYSMQSENKYRSDLNWMKGVGWETEGCLNVAQAKRAGELISDNKYRQKADSIKFTQVADNLSIKHAMKSQELQSDLAYKANMEKAIHQYTITSDDPLFRQSKANADLLSVKVYKSNWEKQKEKGFQMNLESLSILTAKAKRDLASDVKYKEQHERNKGKKISTRSVWDDSQMAHSALATKLQSDRLYKKGFEDSKTKFKVSLDTLNISHAKKAQDLATETNYRTILHDYTTLPNDIHVKWAKEVYGLQSDKQYRSDLKWMKGVGWEASKSLDMQQAKKAGELVSEKKYRQDVSALKFTSVQDSPEMVQAKLSNELAIDRLYRAKSESIRHNYTLNEKLPEVVRAKLNATYISEKVYQSDLNYLRGAPWIATGALQIEGSKKAADLISDKKYRQKPNQFRHTSVVDSPDIVHAKLSGQLTNDRLYKEKGVSDQHKYTIITERPEITQAKINATNFSEVKYKESWLTLRAKGYKLTMQDIPFQAAKSSTGIASDYNYKYNHLQEKGKCIGPKSVLDDPYMRHCQQASRLASDQEYRKDAMTSSRKYHLGNDMINLVTAKNAQALASKQECRNWLHEFTMLPDDMKIKWAKKAYALQSEKLYKSDLSFMKGVAWDGAGAPQLVSAKKAVELISEKKYRQLPESLKFTSVADSPGIIHAKNSYLQCSERLYKSHTNVDMNKYTLHIDQPEFIRAKVNAQQISDKVYKASGQQLKMLGCDLRFDAIPFQTAKASREIASDVQYKESYLKERGQLVGLRSVEDDPRMVHSLAATKLQSNLEYKRKSKGERSQYNIHPDLPEFMQAKKSQAQASDLSYRHRLHDYTCDPEQLNVKHAKHAYKLQSDLNYKSDLNWIRGVGWTPPGSYKAELARRAAELGLAEGVSTDEAIANYKQKMVMDQQQVETSGDIQQGVNMEAKYAIHVKRNNMVQTVQKNTTASSKTMRTTSSNTAKTLVSSEQTSGDVLNQSY